MADFVGSSGTDLAAAIREAGRKTDYRYFWFSYADRAEEAYELERAWHHRFRPADNERSPSRPRDHEWRCTTAGCATCALAVSGR